MHHGVVTLIGVILSNSKSRAVMEVKLDALTEKVEKHNQVLERTYRLEQDMAVARNDIDSCRGRWADMNEFLASNEWQWRLLRTVVQGVLGVVIANLDLIMGWCVLDPSMRGLVVALVMAVLSPIMAALGGDGDKPEIPRGEAHGA
ncbi:MAG: hypothetical protein IKF14_17660 [Atopobiaceae bacterium]|nr:hypothetical protein [Atopobiaceae bacterium]